MSNDSDTLGAELAFSKKRNPMSEKSNKMRDIVKNASRHGLTVRFVEKDDYALGLDQLKLFVSKDNLNKYGLKFDKAQLLYT